MEKIKYTVEYEPGIEDKLRKIPKTMRQRIQKAIEERLMVAPLDYGKPLSYRFRDHRRIRVGDYRIVYRVFKDRILVLIVEIDHREYVYGD